MKNKNNLLYFLCIVWCLLPHAFHADPASYPFKKKRKTQGLLTRGDANTTPQNSTSAYLTQKNKTNITSEIDAPGTVEQNTQSQTPPTTPNTAPKTTVVVPPPMPSNPDTAENTNITLNQSSDLDAPQPQTSMSDMEQLIAQTEKHEPKVVSPKQLEKSLDSEADEIPSIEFHFENTDLQNLVTQIQEIFHVTFLPDEAITPLAAGSKTIAGNKISFKTQKPLTKKDAWGLFLTFLDLSGLALVPQADPKLFKITTTENAQRAPIRAFVGVSPKLLPDNDELIRYVYFIENNTVDAIKGIVDTLRSSTAPFQILQDSKAFILIDKAYNIKTLMQIVVELDKATLPQTLSVLKLRRADAQQVADLYNSITKTDDATITSRLFPARKQPTSLYFPENTRIFAESRTNTLILLGTKDAIAKIEDFVLKHIDVDIDKPYSPLKVVQLKYADAATISDIMTQVTQFGKSTAAGQVGGVRGEDKYLKNMTFTADKTTNSIVVGGEYDDYVKALDIITKLDEPQPQVAMEILIVDITVTDEKQLGTALRSKVPGIDGLVGPNVKFQTSGFNNSGIVENSNPMATGAQRLLGNLINLATGATIGSTIVTLGTDAYGVWGIFQALQTVTNAQVVSNPFVTATNKTPASVIVGQTRRVITGVVSGGSATPQNSFGDDSANIDVEVTPQINSDGMIGLKLTITINQFTEPAPSGTKTTRKIDTNVILADKEILALGGLIQHNISDSVSKVPILGDIPILGWLFKNKNKMATKDNLLILISARILPPDSELIQPLTQERVLDYKNLLSSMESSSDRHDPVHKMFFEDSAISTERAMEDLLFKRHNRNGEFAQHKDKKSRAARRKKKTTQQAQVAVDTKSQKKQVTL